MSRCLSLFLKLKCRPSSSIVMDKLEGEVLAIQAMGSIKQSTTWLRIAVLPQR